MVCLVFDRKRMQTNTKASAKMSNDDELGGRSIQHQNDDPYDFHVRDSEHKKYRRELHSLKPIRFSKYEGFSWNHSVKLEIFYLRLFIGKDYVSLQKVTVNDHTISLIYKRYLA